VVAGAGAGDKASGKAVEAWGDDGGGGGKGGGTGGGGPASKVGRRGLTVSKPVLKAPMISDLEARI